MSGDGEWVPVSPGGVVSVWVPEDTGTVYGSVSGGAYGVVGGVTVTPDDTYVSVGVGTPGWDVSAGASTTDSLAGWDIGGSGFGYEVSWSPETNDFSAGWTGTTDIGASLTYTSSVMSYVNDVLNSDFAVQAGSFFNNPGSWEVKYY